MESPKEIDTPILQSEMVRQGFSFPHRVLSASAAARLLAGLRESRAAIRGRGDLAGIHGVMKPHLLFDWADELAHEPAILDLAEAALGPRLLLWSMDVFARAPAAAALTANMAIAPRGFAWHQDSTYSCLSPASQVVRIWVALTPTVPENGTLRYLPGSHLLGELTHAFPKHCADESRGERVQIDIDESTAVDVVLQSGECSMHDLRLVHESGVNRTAVERVAVALTFVGGAVRPRRPDGALPVRGGSTADHFISEERPRTGDGATRMERYLNAIQTRLSALEFSGS